MSLFKTNPEIFCGGQFKVFEKGSECSFDLDGGWLLEFQEDGGVHDNFALIARPIESMTDEEVVRYSDNCDGIEARARGIWIDMANRDKLTFRTTRYLLSLGIYPGPQSDFDNGNVIAREG